MKNIMEFFQTLSQELPKKNVVKFCNKLAKRKTLDAENALDELCNLCAWLYVYGAYTAIIQCAEITHTFEIPEITKLGNKMKFYHLYDLWGMETRALKLLGQSERADEIKRDMDKIQMTMRTNGLKGLESPEDTIDRENKRREHVHFDELSNENFLELAGKPIKEQGEYRISKSDIPFYQMRGIRKLVAGVEAGVYPNLDVSLSETAITRYADELRKYD